MGKKKLFDKKRSIIFKLIPAVDKNNQSKIMFSPVVPKRCTLSEKQKQDIIKQFSNEHQFDLKNLEEHDERLDGIPLDVLEKIRGRSDLIINGKLGKGPQMVMEQQDFFVEEVSDDEMMEDIQEDDGEYKYGGQQQQDEEDEQSWKTDSQEQEEQKEQIIQEIKPEKQNFEQDFPQLPTPGTAPAIQQQQVQKSKLTKKQLQLLNGILPSNYESMKISGVQMKMFDEDGNPVDGYDYSQHYSRVGGHVLARFEVETIAPTLPDNDLQEEQIPEEGKDIDEALDKADIYQQLQDDFFINLVKMDNVKVTQKQKEAKKVIKREEPKKFIPSKKQIKQPTIEEEEFTQQELLEAMNEMKGITPLKNVTIQVKKIDDNDDEADYEDCDDEDEDEDFENDLEQQDYVDGEQEQEDQRQFHELSKKQKRIFMKNYKIPEVEDLQKQELKIKLKTFKGAKPEQIHLRTIHPKLPFAQDIAMQNTIDKGSDTSSIQTTSDHLSSDDDDIVSYHTKHSTVSSSVNFIMQQAKKKQKKPKDLDESQAKLDIDKPEQPISEKRNKNQTKQEKKLRKQQLKDFKKQKRQCKKEYLQQFKIQKKIIDGNKKGLLHGVSHVNIL